MAIQDSWPLQQAVWSRLSSALAGQGADGADVPVYDHVPDDKNRLHVRIDGLNFVPGTAKNSKRGQHPFSVHVFDSNTGPTTGAGAEHCCKLQTVIVQALEDWVPLPGATAVRHINSTSANDNRSRSSGAISQFSTTI